MTRAMASTQCHLSLMLPQRAAIAPCSCTSALFGLTYAGNKLKHRICSIRAQNPESSSSPQTNQTSPQQEQDNVPSWAQPGSTDPPPWERKQSASASDAEFELPFFVYLLASGIVAIAAIGSIFEYTNKNPIFGVIYPDSSLYTPILGLFAITGLPSAAFLWFKSIELANKEARRQDEEDGFLD